METQDSKVIVGRQLPQGEPLIPLKFNYRYRNVNAGEVAGFPKAEAKQLLEMPCPGNPEKRVAEPYEAPASSVRGRRE